MILLENKNNGKNLTKVKSISCIVLSPPLCYSSNIYILAMQIHLIKIRNNQSIEWKWDVYRRMRYISKIWLRDKRNGIIPTNHPWKKEAAQEWIFKTPKKMQLSGPLVMGTIPLQWLDWPSWSREDMDGFS